MGIPRAQPFCAHQTPCQVPVPPPPLTIPAHRSATNCSGIRIHTQMERISNTVVVETELIRHNMGGASCNLFYTLTIEGQKFNLTVRKVGN